MGPKRERRERRPAGCVVVIHTELDTACITLLNSYNSRIVMQRDKLSYHPFSLPT